MSLALKAFAVLAQGFGAKISNQTLEATATEPDAASVRYELLGTGQARTVVQEVATPVSGEWLIFGAAADYEVLATLESGGITSGPIGSWVSLASNRVWELTRNTDTLGPIIRTLTIQIRRAGETEPFTSATITLSVEVFEPTP